MSKPIIGLVDYRAGNCTSVRNTLLQLGMRSRLVNTADDFKGISLLILPGVGAFASAMSALASMELVEPVREFSLQHERPVIGICLGMQLLADASYEHGYTQGLGLIPGVVKPMVSPNCHIGWNSLEVVKKEVIVNQSDGASFYFNHTYEFQPPEEYVIGVARLQQPVVAMVKRRNICGFQFHPEKSQTAGLKLMRTTIEGLLHA